MEGKITVPRMQIVRGLPGSGKSTFVKTNWPHLLNLEFDQFCQREGRYSWGKDRNAEGQAWLKRMVTEVTGCGFDLTVAGVFAGSSEHLSDTVRTALFSGYNVFIKTLDGSFGNAHGVRPDDLELMKAAFVPDEALEEMLKRLNERVAAVGLPGRVGFGIMGSAYEVAPMEDGK